MHAAAGQLTIGHSCWHLGHMHHKDGKKARRFLPSAKAQQKSSQSSPSQIYTHISMRTPHLCALAASKTCRPLSTTEPTVSMPWSTSSTCWQPPSSSCFLLGHISVKFQRSSLTQRVSRSPNLRVLTHELQPAMSGQSGCITRAHAMPVARTCVRVRGGRGLRVRGATCASCLLVGGWFLVFWGVCRLVAAQQLAPPLPLEQTSHTPWVLALPSHGTALQAPTRHVHTLLVCPPPSV